MEQSTLPVVVIGAGPIGLAAAAQLVSAGETPIILEAGAAVGASVRSWGHVRLFSPWRYNIDKLAAELLECAGWQTPDPDAFPTGAELVERYLEPLAALPEIAPHLHLSSRVLSVTRQGFDKMKSDGREQAPFLVLVETSDGAEEQLVAKAVIDASGTYRSPNPLGASGVHAPGERAAASQIFYGIPDVLGANRDRYAGRAVLVVGSGHSAFNAILDLARLRDEAPGTTITWAVRKIDMRQAYGGGSADALPARGALGAELEQLVARGAVRLVSGFRLQRITRDGARLRVVDATMTLGPFDEIVAATGFRPDRTLLSELRLDLDPVVESTAALAPLIDPNLHSCGSVPPHGADELKHPDPNIYIVGMKSYGRAPTFLMLTGYEQVRSVVAAIRGDWVAARDVQLVLPETGVCVTDLAGSDGGCCGGTSACAAPEAITTALPDFSKRGLQLTVLGDRAGGSCCG